MGNQQPFVLVVDPVPAHARALLEALHQGGLTVESAGDRAAVFAALSATPAPDIAWVTVDAPSDVVKAIVGRGIPFLLALDGRACLPALLSLGPCGCVDVRQSPRTLASSLRSAHARERRAQSSERWAAAVQDVDVACVLADFDGKIVAVNPAYARLAGGATLDPAGTPVASVVAPAEHGVGTTQRDEFDAALHGDQRWAGDVILSSGGSPVPCRATISRYRGPDSTDAGIVIVLVDAQEAVAREATLRETAEQLRDQAARDPLTRLWNRAYLASAIEREIARVRRHGRPLTLLVADLDTFGRVNKLHGLQGGDEVLRGIAGAMQTAVRLGDILTRYAGDEFCVLLPESARAEGAEVAERLRDRVRSVRTPGTAGRPMTVSIGLACTDESQEVPSSAELFSVADRRLRAAKRRGGDRVVEDDNPDETAVPVDLPARPNEIRPQ